MPAATDLDTLVHQLLLGAFLIGAAFGAIAQHTRFCTMGALADVFSFGDRTRLRAWVAAVAVAVLGFHALVGLGWVQAADSLYGGPRVGWLSALVGGGLFGVGMVLASGCAARNLVRLGGGSLKSLVVLLVVGASALAAMKGASAVLRAASVDRVAFELAPGQDAAGLLAAAAGLPLHSVAPWLGLAVALALLAWVFARPEGRSAEVAGGAAIGALVVAAWWLSGRLGFVPEHPETLEPAFLATNSRRMESLSLVAPLAWGLDWLLFFSDSRKTLTIGICSAAGIVAGSAAVALATRRFRWEGFAGSSDTANHLLGALLMGTGGVTALGCTVGQGIAGLSTLSANSFIAVSAMVLGGFAGLALQQRRIERGG
ncbi:transporter [Rubrivivax gelatinosus]|nr:transporter [Rubrivivax gelatinosus]